MARTRKFDENQALDAALRLFWEKGYVATSLQDLEKGTGLNRASIYNAFGNKRSLFKKCLTLYVGRVQAMLEGVIGTATSSREAIKNWLACVIDFQFNQETPSGCLVILSALERHQHDRETREIVTALFRREQEVIQKVLEEGVQRGEFPADFDCVGVAWAITSATSGMVVLSMADLPVSALQEVFRSTMRLLDGK
ncbi:MAG: TetR/AcrR family transcriptional regulator [Desulfurivibrio sp.]|nr:TetR/AcrR family transcriptional regulator [Desulfurivibrio sp.]MBU3936637.1 TetR/AcrR family transcriptional regulator [Pseudomonadota bacterium]MBU4034420.1 TetR/AcrR family transcriptional regulator [Pseudomonadota bacterium]MBU4118770.1 TetR/AcrR family transcriptional regulator [Pseudomonadota bacterium]